MPENREALRDPDTKRELNRNLFNRIASRYDIVTRLLSLGRDSSWKRALVAQLPAVDPRVCLDVASGSGDIAALLAERYPSARIQALDLSEEMIIRARLRLAGNQFEFTCGDISSLPYPDGSADLVTGGYALRNVPDLGQALAQIHRVLKPGGVAFFLDFVQPPPGARRIFQHFLLHAWGSLVGLAIHLRPSTYRYIPQSLAQYPSAIELRTLFEKAGFEFLRRKRHFFGIMERLEVRKPYAGQ